MLAKLKALKEDFTALYGKGIISVDSDKAHLEPKLFRELAKGHPITASWNTDSVSVECVVDGLRLLTLL